MTIKCILFVLLLLFIVYYLFEMHFDQLNLFTFIQKTECFFCISLKTRCINNITEM